MPVDLNKIWVSRIIPIQNLDYILHHGLFSKKTAKFNSNYVGIANSEIVEERDKRIVKCYPDTQVNDYVPFYFSFRTPMLYNIITGRGVDKRKQSEILYLCFKLTELATENFKWCFTDGNAAKKTTRFTNNLSHINDIDWNSIRNTDFRVDNSDGDTDRIRKKHAEFLVFNYVPRQFINSIVVLNDDVKYKVEEILLKHSFAISVFKNPEEMFYFDL